MADVRGGRRRPPFSRFVSLTSFASKRDTGTIESRPSPSLCGRSLASPNGREARVLLSLTHTHTLSLSLLPLSSTSLVRGLACSAFSDRPHPSQSSHFTLQPSLLGLSSFDRVARDLNPVVRFYTFRRPHPCVLSCIARAAGATNEGPCAPAAKALVAALSVPSLLQWFGSSTLRFDASSVEILWYSIAGDAPRKISILVVMSLWFGRLLKTGKSTNANTVSKKKKFRTNNNDCVRGVDRVCESHANTM